MLSENFKYFNTPVVMHVTKWLLIVKTEILMIILIIYTRWALLCKTNYSKYIFFWRIYDVQITIRLQAPCLSLERKRSRNINYRWKPLYFILNIQTLKRTIARKIMLYFKLQMASVILNVVSFSSYCDYDDISKILILVDCFYYANSRCVIYVGNQKLCAQKMSKIFYFSTRTSSRQLHRRFTRNIWYTIQR